MEELESMERSAVGPATMAGLVSAGAALSAGEVVSGLDTDIRSLVVAVADVIVDEAPGSVVRWSIDTFGASQKPLLVTGVVMASLVVGAGLGVTGRTRPGRAVAGFFAFGVLGGWAAARQPEASFAGSWFSAIVAAAVGATALLVLLRMPSSVRAGVGAGDASGARDVPAVDRRWFLAAAGATAVFSALGVGISRRLRQSAVVEAARTRIAAGLGATAPVVPTGVDVFDGSVPGISPLITPNQRFYRIDTALLVPQVDVDGWTLRVTGMVDRELELTFDDLLALERVDEFVTLSCVSNEVGGNLVGNALWSGVPLAALLNRAGVDPAATQVVGRSVDGWTAGFPTAVALDGRPSLIAVAMNGEPLPASHGFPARLVVPGLYGYVSATKWLREIELTTWEAFDGYWIPRGWAKEGPIKTQSRIDVPRRGATIPAGRTAVAGVAWAPTRSIDRVEVRVDDDGWTPARLSGELSVNAWVQWMYEWEATPGPHRLQVRATDGTGAIQPTERTSPAPSGATGHHTVVVEVVEAQVG